MPSPRTVILTVLGWLPATAAVVLAAALALTAGCSAPTADEPAVTAFAGVDVLTMDSAEILEAPEVLTGHTVVVDGGRVAALGPAAEVTIPEGARIVDGEGLTLVPGLVDMHVHNWLPEDHVLFLANGVTTIRNLWGREEHLAWRREIAEGERLGPTIYTSGPIVDGDPPVIPANLAVDDPLATAAIVRSQKEAGYDLVKVYSVLRPEVLEAVCASAREAGLPVTGHVPLAVPLRDAFAWGMTGVEHLSGYRLAMQADGSPLTRLDYDGWRALPRDELARRVREHLDPSKLDEVVRLSCEHGVWNTPTLVVGERLIASGGELQQLARRPEMRFAPQLLRRMWEQRPNPTPEERRTLEDAQVRHRAIVRALEEAGCGVLVGTDTPNPFVVPGFSIHEELELLVEAGLTPNAALQSATVRAARALGAEDEIGRVAVGLRADLVLLEASPLVDVRNTRRIRGVMARGRWLPATELERRLDDVARYFEENPDLNPFAR